MIHPTNDELNELVDGRLSPAEKRRLLSHMEECRTCSSAFRLLALVDQSARRQRHETPGVHFVDTLMKKITPLAEQAAHSRFDRLLKLGSNLFAFLVVVGLVYGVWGLAGRYMPSDSSAMQQIESLSNIRNEAAGWWSRTWSQIGSGLSVLMPGGKIPLWIPAIWSIIIVFLLDKIAGKRLRRNAS